MKEEKLKELKKADLLSEINQLQTALSNSYENMQLAKDDDLLDYYAYRIKSQEAMHKFLINQFKNLE